MPLNKLIFKEETFNKTVIAEVIDDLSQFVLILLRMRIIVNS